MTLTKDYIFSKKCSLGIKTLTLKQMLQRLLITPVQLKAENDLQKLLKKIAQILYSLS